MSRLGVVMLVHTALHRAGAGGAPLDSMQDARL